jgi:ubiquinone biosynthesis protein
MVIRRISRWLASGAVLGAALLLDRRRGRTSLRERAARLREHFERVGGPAVKFGQQLSIRVDMLPFEVCDELGKLTDAVPPMRWEDAHAVMARGFGRPPEDVFASIDPSPIGSASIATVYRAVLKSGEPVAVKVVRVGVASQFAADLATIDLLTAAFERLTLVRPGFFVNLRAGVRSMFMEELDLRLEARYQTLFARCARKDGLDWVEVPAVYRDLSGPDVLVSAFVDAIPLNRVLRAVDTRDEAAIAAFRAQGVDPTVLRDRILTLSLWSRFEAPFFHADPHPANVFVRPGGTLVMLDFGACCVNSTQVMRSALEVIRRMNADDVPGVASVSVHNNSPLPYIDTREFQRDIELTLWRFHQGLRDPDAEWWERTTATLWAKIAEASRRYGIPMSLGTLRALRSTLLYDSLAFRLAADPGQDTVSRYLADARARQGRKNRRNRDKPAFKVDRAELRARLGRGLRRLSAVMDEVRALRKLDVSVPARVAVSALRGAQVVVVALAAACAVSLLVPASLRPALREAVTSGVLTVIAHPITWALACVAMIIAVRDVRFRPDQARRRRW